MKFDKYFYIQQNRDSSGRAIDLYDFNNCQMRGTKRYPVVTSKVNNIEIDDSSLLSGHKKTDENEITLKLILDFDATILMKKSLSYYMQFLFYDSDKSIILFFFNAKVVKISNIPKNNGGRRTSLVITSARRNGLLSYKIFEKFHEEAEVNFNGVG